MMKLYQKASQVAGMYRRMCKYGEIVRPDGLETTADQRLSAVNDKLPHGGWFDTCSRLVEDPKELGNFLGMTDEEMLDRKNYDPDRCIYFYTEYHCMNDNGMYCGWCTMLIVVSASLSCGFDIDGQLLDGKEAIAELMSGEDYNGVWQEYTAEDVELDDINFYLLDYVLETFQYALEQEVEW